MNDNDRINVWFSCGAASAVALKLAVNMWGSRVCAIYCDLSQSEDADNVRFRQDVEKWVGAPIQVIRSEKYATVDDVFEDKRYHSGPNGAPCTREMKKMPRIAFQHPTDVHVFGFTDDERDRMDDFEDKNPDLKCTWVLRGAGFSKQDCFAILKFVGIALPRRYLQGFINNNCEACVKASSLAYWVHTRKLNPESFARRADQSRRFGSRLTRWKGKRIFLDEIPPDDQIPARFLKMRENISCGPECGVAK